MADSSSREYGIIVVGASGFTGTHTCLHIAARLPTSLRWAIAGRSQERLEKLAARLRKEYPDRVQPELEIVTPSDAESLGQAVRKANVCISNVIYPLEGDLVIRACVEGGTDYVDSAAVPTLVKSWITKYHKQAEQNGVALIHSCGALSGAMDLMAVHASQQLASRWSAKMGEMTLRVDEIDTNVSGGTFRTMLSYACEGSKANAEAERPTALTPVPYTTTPNLLSGVHYNPVLGWLSNSSPSLNQVRALVNRTWGLLGGPDGSWGPDFQYNEYDMAHSFFGGIVNLIRCTLIMAIFSLGQFALVKNLLLSLVPEAGSGPSDEEIKSVPVRMQALVAASPGEKHGGKFCHIKLRCDDGHYPFAGGVMAQAAATLLYDRKLSAGIRGGCLTPGILGERFVERVLSGGVQLETALLENVK